MRLPTSRQALASAFSALAALFVMTLATGEAEAKKAKATIYHPACQGDNPVCGAIAYVNEGGYVVNPTKVYAKSDQPNYQEIHPQCAGAEEKYDADIDVDQYVVFVMPADCYYELKINIEAGNHKSRNILLTPGCEYIGKTKGTTLSNSWHTSVQWIDGDKPAGAPDKPVDQEGHECG